LVLRWFALSAAQVRLEAMETVVAKAQSPEAAECVQTLAQGVANLPGWDDKNFQVRSSVKKHDMKYGVKYGAKSGVKQRYEPPLLLL
jgi:hypothetical protein